MTKYWIKIGVGALLIFGVGFVAYASGRSIVRHVESDQDITIPLGSFIPFNVAGEKLGTLRSLTVMRSAPKELAGFAVRARLNDAAAVERLQNCRFSVTDPENIDERTMFICLSSDSGYQPFGEMRLEVRVDGDIRTTVLPLLLPSATVREIMGARAGVVTGADSMAGQIRARVRIQSRAHADSVRAANLEERARRMQQQADSIRALRSPTPPQP